MKRICVLLLLLFSVYLFSQSKIIVKESGTEIPLRNALVKCENKILGKTGADGILEFKTKCKKLTVSASGYFEDDVISDKVMEVFLAKSDPKMQSIQTVILEDKSDPRALEILKKVNDNYKENSPKSLDSYSFKSYEKISFDLDEDSIRNYNTHVQKRIDSLSKFPQKEMSKDMKKDSLEEINMMKLMGESKLFLWERASEFLYSEKYGEKINILDNRVSGLNQPLYEMMALRSNRNQIPREVREENRSLYRFFLTDTIEIDGRKNFVIRFRQVDYKQPVQRRKFNGYLYIDTETYGIKKIESNSKIKSEGSITSVWKPFNNKWFLVKENLKIRMGMTFVDEKKNADGEENKNRAKFGNYVFMSSDYFDFKSPIEEKTGDFKGYTMDVKNSDGSLLEKYRTEPLSEREQNTYQKVDSLGSKYKLDQKARIATGLLKGKIRFGMVDIDAGRILGFNQYEKFRLGIAAKLNEKFNRYISPDAYIAYGFGDETFKYGAGIDVRTTLAKNSFFRAEYFDDVMAAGRFSENLWNFRMKIMNAGVALNNPIFYHYKGFRLMYENDITNGITMNFSAKRTDEKPLFNYQFKNLGNDFDVFSTNITLKFSPNSRNIMTPSGKYTYEQKFPELYLNYEQGWKSMGGTLSYSRYDALFAHNFKTDIGVTGFRIFGGMAAGDAPIWHNFTMSGLGNGKDDLNFNLTSYLGFATMPGGEFYNDKFVGTYITHRIPWYFKSFGKNTSSFDAVYRGVIGNMKNPEFHQFNFQKLDHLYNEIGLEWNNFLSSQFNLGFFYRIGHYATPRFKDNFAIQFKTKILGF
ncbi:MAG: DUF5686 family protein [Bergeyella sp.]